MTLLLFHMKQRVVKMGVVVQIYAMPVFDMMESVLVKKLRFRPSWYLRLITRSSYVGMQKTEVLHF